jgi:hypothetical protein
MSDGVLIELTPAVTVGVRGEAIPPAAQDQRDYSDGEAVPC